MPARAKVGVRATYLPRRGDWRSMNMDAKHVNPQLECYVSGCLFCSHAFCAIELLVKAVCQRLRVMELQARHNILPVTRLTR